MVVLPHTKAKRTDGEVAMPSWYLMPGNWISVNIYNINKIFKGFSEDSGTNATDPMAKHLFQVQDVGEAQYLSEE